uniref:Succinate dehydrogenase subunit 3 n=1 Tax=California macrophylla TaxID=337344 RepID=A0A0G2YF89_9ROSI|nr:succinate dehydrogenase subunit 3 [California macrophylla]
MLRIARKKLSSLPSTSLRASSAFTAQGGVPGSGSRSNESSMSISSADPICSSSRLPDLIRGYLSGEVTKLVHGVSLRDLQEDLAKVKNPENLVNGVFSHLGSIYSPKGLAPYQHLSLRHYASPAAEQNSTPHAFRPLSPHLPVYQPQLNSTLSIFNRISGMYLTGVALAFYLLTMKMGSVCLTYEGFYKTLFYSSKLIPVTLEISALALAYHLYASIRHMKKL